MKIKMLAYQDLVHPGVVYRVLPSPIDRQARRWEIRRVVSPNLGELYQRATEARTLNHDLSTNKPGARHRTKGAV